MAKPKNNSTVIIETAEGSVEVPRDSRICVVKQGEILGVETEEAWQHDYAVTVYDSDYRLAPLEIEGGASMVLAGLWSDHIEAGSPGLVQLVKAGHVTVYTSAESAHKMLPERALKVVLTTTRHGAVLREWERLEQDSNKPRRALLDGLRERLRIFRDYAPAEHAPPIRRAPTPRVEATAS